MAAQIDQTLLAQKIAESLQKTRAEVDRLRRINTFAIVFGLLSSAATTLVTGITAAHGPVVGEGPTGWKMSCLVAAILAFVATISVGLPQQLQLGDRLAQYNQALGRLKSLDVAIVTASRSWDEIAHEYEDIVRTYPNIIL